MFIGAFANRNSGYGPGGPGAIYVVKTDGSAAPSVIATIPNAGTTARGTNGYLRDSDFFDRPGKESLGDL